MMQNENIAQRFATVHSGKNGAIRFTVPIVGYSITWALSASGDCSAEIQMSDELAGINLRDQLRKWGTILCVYRADGAIDGAIMVKDRKYNFSTHRLSITGVDGWGLLSKRLVMNPDLSTNWKDGTVLIDDNHPRPDWQSRYTGSKPDIAIKLLQDSAKIGEWPYVYTGLTGGSNVKTYDNWSPMYLDDALSNLIKEQDGIEVIFIPEIDEQTQTFVWLVVAADEIKLHTYELVDGLPDNQWYFVDDTDLGTGVVNQAFGFGGKLDDKLVVARGNRVPSGAEADVPLLQIADTSHNTVSDVATLSSYMKGAVQIGRESQDSIEIAYNRLRYNVAPGDWLNIRSNDPYIGIGNNLKLKVLSISYDNTSMGRLTARERL